MYSSSINLFQCGIYYLPDWFLGQRNRFYSIGGFEWGKKIVVGVVVVVDVVMFSSSALAG